MENGNIMDFIKAHPNHNRSELVSEGTERNPQAILIDSTAVGGCEWPEVSAR